MLARIFLVLSLSAASPAAAQHTLDTVSPAPYHYPARSFTITYKNDVFAKTDRYFTQGVELRIAHPALQRMDVLHILSPFAKPTVRYTASLLHESFTPSSIRSDSILRGDRPYASTAALRIEGFGYSRNGGESVAAAAIIGVIGQPAQGREIQTAIHRATGDFIPLGWQHQIRTDVLINYSLEYRRAFLGSKIFGLTASGRADAGTLQCRLSAGLHALLSRSRAGSLKFRPSVSAEVRGYAVGYDARLQGGIFNRTSPYVLRSREISRAVASARIRADLRYRKSGIGGEYAWLTREFSAGLPHAWGGLFVYHYFR